MQTLRVIVVQCPECKRTASVVIDRKTAVKAFCKDCSTSMRPFHFEMGKENTNNKPGKEQP
ncbi:MAG: CPXCG motif-containing cysteine-rich protein [Candidatus Kryptoniota bacterium]